MFNYSLIFAIAEYEREHVSSIESEGIIEVRPYPYENGKIERLNTP